MHVDVPINATAARTFCSCSFVYGEREREETGEREMERGACAGHRGERERERGGGEMLLIIRCLLSQKHADIL